MATGQPTTELSAVDEFISKVRAKLASNKWTITRLAAEAGVGRPYLHRVLSGEQEPTLRHAEKIGKPLGLSLKTVARKISDK